MNINWRLAVGVPVLVTAAGIGTMRTAIAEDTEVYQTGSGAIFARSGWYVGADLGGAFNPGATTWNGGGFTSNVVNRVNKLLEEKGNSGAVTGGIYGGYQYRWRDYPIVSGIELDFNGIGDLRKNDSVTYVQTCATCVAPPGTYTVTSGKNTNYFGTVRGHFGYIPRPDMEIYISGGFAYAGNSGTGNGGVTYTPVGGGAAVNFRGNGGGNTHTGSAIGGGFSWGFMPDLAVRVEGIYIDLKSEDRTFTVPSGTYNIQESAKFHFTVVRVGLTYKF